MHLSYAEANQMYNNKTLVVLKKWCEQMLPPPSTPMPYALCPMPYALCPMPRMLSTNSLFVLLYILEVVIGFLSDRYSVSETDGTVSIEFGVITGSLGTTIFVQLSLSDGSAMCKLLST